MICALAGLALVFEYIWVGVQAAQAKRSHFNFDSNFEALMYAAMGLGAVLLMTIAMALAVQIYRKGDRSRRFRVPEAGPQDHPCRGQ